MVSVGLDRASRGLTAIPVHAAAGQNRSASRCGHAKQWAPPGRFFVPRGAPAPHRPEHREPGFGAADAREEPVRGKNLSGGGWWPARRMVRVASRQARGHAPIRAGTGRAPAFPPAPQQSRLTSPSRPDHADRKA